MWEPLSSISLPRTLLCTAVAAAIMSTAALEVGTDICACQPAVYEFTVEFADNCENLLSADDGRPGIDYVSCNSFSTEIQSTSLIPTTIDYVVITEYLITGTEFPNTYIEGPFADGDKFTYAAKVTIESIDESNLPSGILIQPSGSNAEGVSISQSTEVGFDSDCEVNIYPLFKEGDRLGWVRLTKIVEPPPIELCPSQPKPAPTAEPTARPTAAPTAEPTTAPMQSPATVMPTIAGTSVDYVIEDVMVEFEGVQRLSIADIRQWEILTENWFNDFYGSRRRRQLHKNKQGAEEEGEGEDEDYGEEEKNDLYYHHRGLQSPQSVRNMDATFTVQSQEPSQELNETKNTLQYTQRLKYVLLPGGGTPEQYATLPWRNILANGEYGRRLSRNIDGFSDVVFPVGIPILPSPAVGPTVSPTVSPTMPEINLQLQTAPDTPLEISLDDDVETVNVREWPQNGSLVVGDNMIVYTPFAGFIGLESFVVQVCNVDKQCTEMAITVQVGITDEDNGNSTSPTVSPTMGPAAGLTEGPSMHPTMGPTESPMTQRPASESSAAFSPYSINGRVVVVTMMVFATCFMWTSGSCSCYKEKIV